MLTAISPLRRTCRKLKSRSGGPVISHMLPDAYAGLAQLQTTIQGADFYGNPSLYIRNEACLKVLAN
jgi:hypothetical protein